MVNNGPAYLFIPGRPAIRLDSYEVGIDLDFDTEDSYTRISRLTLVSKIFATDTTVKVKQKKDK